MIESKWPQDPVEEIISILNNAGISFTGPLFDQQGLISKEAAKALARAKVPKLMDMVFKFQAILASRNLIMFEESIQQLGLLTVATLTAGDSVSVIGPQSHNSRNNLLKADKHRQRLIASRPGLTKRDISEIVTGTIYVGPGRYSRKK